MMYLFYLKYDLNINVELLKSLILFIPYFCLPKTLNKHHLRSISCTE